MKPKFYIVLILSCLLAGGCSSTQSQSKHNLILENKSSREMHEAILTMGDYQCAFGFLATPGAKGILGYPKPFAEVAHLSWNARGVEHEETVHLSSVIPGSKAIGTLIITVYENRLAARFEAEPKISK